jgi:hypothetical protein
LAPADFVSAVFDLGAVADVALAAESVHFPVGPIFDVLFEPWPA